MSGDEVMRAAVAALIYQLEQPHALPLGDDTLLSVLSDGEFEAHRFEARRLAEEQQDRYFAAAVPKPPKSVTTFEDNRVLDVKSRKSRKAQRKTLLNKIAKMKQRLGSHDRYLADQWAYLWRVWDGLSAEEQAWFEPAVTLSDRGPDNLPKLLDKPPITVRLPGEQHFKVQAQIEALKRLLGE